MPDDKSYPLGLPPGVAETKDYISLDQSWKYSDDNIDFMADFAKVLLMIQIGMKAEGCLVKIRELSQSLASTPH